MYIKDISANIYGINATWITGVVIEPRFTGCQGTNGGEIGIAVITIGIVADLACWLIAGVNPG